MPLEDMRASAKPRFASKQHKLSLTGYGALKNTANLFNYILQLRIFTPTKANQQTMSTPRVQLKWLIDSNASDYPPNFSLRRELSMIYPISKEHLKEGLDYAVELLYFSLRDSWMHWGLRLQCAKITGVPGSLLECWVEQLKREERRSDMWHEAKEARGGRTAQIEEKIIALVSERWRMEATEA